MSERRYAIDRFPLRYKKMKLNSSKYHFICWTASIIHRVVFDCVIIQISITSNITISNTSIPPSHGEEHVIHGPATQWKVSAYNIYSGQGILIERFIKEWRGTGPWLAIWAWNYCKDKVQIKCWNSELCYKHLNDLWK
jgi:hypothetical protein